MENYKPIGSNLRNYDNSSQTQAACIVSVIVCNIELLFTGSMMQVISDFFTVPYVIAALAIGYYAYFLFGVWYKRVFTNLPPCNYGRIPIPFIGCAIEFGKGPLMYVKQMQRKVGHLCETRFISAVRNV